MKQALHIFLKDIRRLWQHIAAVMLAIGYFAWLDVRLSAVDEISGTGTQLIQFIVGAAVWFLIARAVHEEPLPGENQFWLTRPYERSSLLFSKVLMLVWVVAVPLFVADYVILSAQSLSVTGDWGGLMLRQLLTAAWLILPPFAIGSITRSITEDVMVWLVGLAIAGLGYFPTRGADIRTANEKYVLAVALIMLLAVVWRQYSKRATLGSRVMIAAAILLPVLPFPEPAALAIEGLGSKPATAGISITAKVKSIAATEPPDADSRLLRCAFIPVAASGVHPGWRLTVMSQRDVFEAAGGKTSLIEWRGRSFMGPRSGDFNDATAGSITACLTSAELKDLGAAKPLAVHVSVALAVFAENAPIRVTAAWVPFDVPGIGRCQFQHYPSSRNFMLACTAPIRFPPQGTVSIATREGMYSPIRSAEYPWWVPMNLLPGLSPVYKWVTLPLDNEIRNAVARGGQIEFRTETPIGVLRREIDVPDVRFPSAQ